MIMMDSVFDLNLDDFDNFDLNDDVNLDDDNDDDW